MTSKEVIKAMECCYVENELTCEDCPMFKKSISWCKEEIAEKCIEIVKSLQDENETLKSELKKELDEHEKFTKNAKVEIERLTKDKSFATRKMMESKAKVVELQKQVDELTERYLEESKERCEFEQKYKKIQHAHNIGLGTQRSHWEKKVEQAVKDTAKEILQYVGDLYDDGDQRFQLKDYQWHKDLCKRYGVEVEE